MAYPSVTKKFTSYNKDTEASSAFLNYAIFRQHSARLGRFHMADPILGKRSNPQSLNRFSYGLSDPINNVDPKGLLQVKVEIPSDWPCSSLDDYCECNPMDPGDGFFDPVGPSVGCFASGGGGGGGGSAPTKCDQEYQDCLNKAAASFNSCTDSASSRKTRRDRVCLLIRPLSEILYVVCMERSASKYGQDMLACNSGLTSDRTVCLAKKTLCEQGL